MLQQSFLHIFGVAQNFQLNGEGLMAKKGGGGDAPPGYVPVAPPNSSVKIALHPLR